jgi:Raf kinase inhibitor-like YbhB/YbcL family protein
MKLHSSAFGDGARIPGTYTGDGADVSPPLEWSDVPEGVKEFALVCDDPDAPTPKPWVHWVVNGIPADVRRLDEGASQQKVFPGVEGRNSWNSGRTIGYRGPAPPPGHGVHHYRFHLYALDAAVRLQPGAEAGVLLRAIAGHTLAEAETVGTYERK